MALVYYKGPRYYCFGLASTTIMIPVCDLHTQPGLGLEEVG
jgi:hypothetical protein